MNSNKIIAKFTFWKIFACFFTLLCAFCGIMSWQAGERGISIMFFTLIGLGIFLLIFIGSLEINNQAILYKCFWANYKINWEEVEEVKMDAQGNTIIFSGGDKKLPVIGPSFWSKKIRIEMLKLIASQAKERQIELKDSQMIGFTLSKNTKTR